MIFLGGLLLVKVVMGEVVSSEDLGGGDVYICLFGVVDYLVENDEYVIVIVCNIVVNLNKILYICVIEIEELLFDVIELYGVVLSDVCKLFDICEVIVCIVDGLCFDEFKVCFGIILVIGFVKIYGMFVGIIVNNGILFLEFV